MDYVIDTVMTPLSLSYIRQLHILLTQATYAQRRRKIGIDSFRAKPASINKQVLTPPGKIEEELTALITAYERKYADLKLIVNFHAKFEHIHPFDDYNGRVGRLIMIKECLRNEVDLFIIDDKKRGDYNSGIAEWDRNKFLLMDTVIRSQEYFQGKMELCRLMEYCKPVRE